MTSENKLVLECDCGGEILICNEETINNPDGSFHSREFSLAFYTYGTYIDRPNMWQRIKYAWYHLKTGKIYGDYVILNENKADILATFIKNNINKKNGSR
jgi:hypothetical protein